MNIENAKYIKRPKKDFNFSLLKGKERIEYIKEHTNGLNNINLNEVKQLEADVWGNVYVVLNNKQFYKNEVLEDSNVREILVLENGNLYRIREDNTIIPLKSKEKWDDVDIYLYNQNKEYKKIITRGSNIICLTTEKKVISVCFFELLGIIPENFIDVEDICMKKSKMYIVKEEKEIPLYITGEWEERIFN